MAGLDIEEQLQQLSMYTFSNFIKCDEIQQFLAETREPHMPALRYTYIYFLFRKIGAFIGEDSVLSCFFNDDVINPSVTSVFNKCKTMTTPKKLNLCYKLEMLTRGQINNAVWEVLRDGIISSSKFSKAVKGYGVSHNLFQPIPIKNDHYVASPLAFGLRCEETVKLLMTGLIYPEKNSCDQCGFLLSPNDGLFGVSLDLTMNVKSGDLKFLPETEIYEIKSRYKYLFGKNEFDALLPKYRQLYQDPCTKNFISFVYGITKPAVEFVPDGRLPSEADYLLTSDISWNLMNPKRKRKMTSAHYMINECMSSNADLNSTVFLFSDPSETGGLIQIKKSFDVNVHINPRHQYFSQLLLQSKVVSDYLTLDGIKSKVASYIVTAFFRKRDSTDPLICYIGEDRELDPEVEIPVAILLTPVRFSKRLTHYSLSKAVQHWKLCARETFRHSPWVQDYPQHAAV